MLTVSYFFKYAATNNGVCPRPFQASTNCPIKKWKSNMVFFLRLLQTAVLHAAVVVDDDVVVKAVENAWKTDN